MQKTQVIIASFIAGLFILIPFEKNQAKALRVPPISPSAQHHITNLKVIGESLLSNTVSLKKTAVGGLSGIDYNPKTDEWIMISDDRGLFGPARFYKATLSYNEQQFQSVQINKVTILKAPSGAPFPNPKTYEETHKGEVPDLESIRFDPRDGSIWYTSEGNREKDENPFIFHTNKNGDYLSSYLIPNAYSINKKKKLGIRQNTALEGTSFTPDGNFYFTALEGPLLQDGPLPSVKKGALSRIAVYNRQGEVISEYAYPVSALPQRGRFGTATHNGISEILAINAHQFLVLERASFMTNEGKSAYSIRLYKCSTKGATNVQPMKSLASKTLTPVKKALLLDFDSLHLPQVGNIEGMAWGPKLKNGDDSLVFVSDNNFSSRDITQFIAFDVQP